jgi:hypothetical protein
MQETWRFDLPQLFQNKKPENQIQEILIGNQKDLGIFLSYYYKKEGAVSENVQLSGPISFSEDFKGSFLVEFDLIYYNACLNIHEQNKEKMKIHFNLDQESNQLILTGPYWPEREMDEI